MLDACNLNSNFLYRFCKTYKSLIDLVGVSISLMHPASFQIPRKCGNDIAGVPYTREMTNETLVAGDDLDIRCKVSGYPIKDIKWMKGRKDNF